MKVLVTAISFSSKISGVQRHAFSLVRCLLAHPEVSEVHLAIAPWQREMTEDAVLNLDSRLVIHVAQLKADPISRNLWHYYALPELSNRLRPDLIHLTYPVPIDAAALRCPVVLTLHDLYPYEIPSNFGFPRFIFNRLILRQSLRSVDAVACVSDATLLRLKQFVPEPGWRNAGRIFNCVEPLPSVIERVPLPELVGTPFLLCVAQHRRNKNIPLAIRVFDSLLKRGGIHPATRLVIVGIAGPETASIHRLVARRSLSSQVLFHDGLSDSELQWCYMHCDALVVPSIAEGFGLPVAEGLLAGCKVICSDIPALREIGGEQCLYFSLGKNEEEAFANAITVGVKKPKRPAIKLPHLSAEILAREYVNLYREVLEARFAEAAMQPARKELRDNSTLREV